MITFEQEILRSLDELERFDNEREIEVAFTVQPHCEDDDVIRLRRHFVAYD